MTASLTVKLYLTAVKEEQLLARTVPIQDEPFLIQDLFATSSEILKRLSGRISSPTQLFVLAREQVFLKTLIFGAIEWVTLEEWRQSSCCISLKGRSPFQSHANEISPPAMVLRIYLPLSVTGKLHCAPLLLLKRTFEFVIWSGPRLGKVNTYFFLLIHGVKFCQLLLIHRSSAAQARLASYTQ